MRSRINCLHPPVNVSRSLSAARSFRSQPISVIVIPHPVEASAYRASTNALLVTRGAMNMHAVVITNSTAGLQWLWRSPYPSVTALGRKRSLNLVSFLPEADHGSRPPRAVYAWTSRQSHAACIRAMSLGRTCEFAGPAGHGAGDFMGRIPSARFTISNHDFKRNCRRASSAMGCSFVAASGPPTRL